MLGAHIADWLRLVADHAASRAVERAVAKVDAGRGTAGLLSVQKAAEWLDCSPGHVIALVRAGEVDAVDGIGRGRKVTVASLERLVERRAALVRKRTR